ncbi:aldehyde dehydrogenase family protein [Litchfieldella xinjiangensis]|uniref:aldehyde dehydrogenase family protein n=1 Tax=Litchfieldella xinjiangensis TaxID=1166948 RepID=UPI0005BE1584|nr:aldehyde dehydrogenase family protein [Halomonas xinjiangensis]
MEQLIHQFIGNRWVRSQATRTLPVCDPYRETQIAEVTVGDASDVEAAVQAARQALPEWSRLPSQRRAAYLEAIAHQLQHRYDELVELSSRNNGKPISEAEIDLDDAIACYRYYSERARELDDRQGRPVALEMDGITASVYQDPVGVVGLIIPWNFPLVTSAWKLAPALAAGCTVILKPSEIVPLPEQALAEIMLAIDLPPGVFNLVHGDGENVGIPLTQHKGIDKLSFTGSNRVGEQVMRAAADGIRNISLELGGKSPILVLDDADVEQAAEWVMNGICFNAGQMCSATSRLIVHSSLAEPLYALLGEKIDALTLGDPLDRTTSMGPLSGARQWHAVRNYLAVAKNEQLDAVRDERHRTLPKQGFFIAPTLYRDVPTTSRLWKEEIFGPVLCARSVSSDQDAIALANDSPFGLAATVISGDTQRARGIARQLQAGNVWYNTDQVAPPQAAWGGYKASGIGRELGPLGLAAYQETKHVIGPVAH